MMNAFGFATFLVLVASTVSFAQQAPTSGMNITLEEVERRALDRNPRVAQARLETDIADYAVAESRTVYTPSLTLGLIQRSQTNPSTSQLEGGQDQVTNEAVNYSSRLSQQVPWLGGGTPSSSTAIGLRRRTSSPR